MQEEQGMGRTEVLRMETMSESLTEIKGFWVLKAPIYGRYMYDMM